LPHFPPNNEKQMKMNFPSKTIIIYAHLLVGGSALISMSAELGQQQGGHVFSGPQTSFKENTWEV